MEKDTQNINASKIANSTGTSESYIQQCDEFNKVIKQNGYDIYEYWK